MLVTTVFFDQVEQVDSEQLKVLQIDVETVVVEQVIIGLKYLGDDFGGLGDEFVVYFFELLLGMFLLEYLVECLELVVESGEDEGDLLVVLVFEEVGVVGEEFKAGEVFDVKIRDSLFELANQADELDYLSVLLDLIFKRYFYLIAERTLVLVLYFVLD